jgi:epoxyqueuosine reductase
MKRQLRQWAVDAGADFCGFTRIANVSDDAVAAYRNWIAQGRHGTMAYMERYDDVRTNPALLLDGAQTLMVCLFNYHTNALRTPCAPRIADYALGTDYHDELRARLAPVAQKMQETYGATSRVCIDTAPLRERYWAAQAGLGFIGRNNHLIVPGHAPLQHCGCGTCRACIEACPTGALIGDGSCNTSRCLSYLTIENRDDLPRDINLAGNIYGCDICRLACPHNRFAVSTRIEAFQPRPAVLALTLADWLTMSPEQYRLIFKGSAIKRAKLAHLQAIARHF